MSVTPHIVRMLVVSLVAGTLLLLPLPASAAGGFGQFDADAVGHDAENAYLLSLLSHYVYVGNHEGATDATFEAAFEDHFDGMGLSNFDFFSFPLLDAEAAVVETSDAVIVTFRGTEPPSWSPDFIDILTDLSMTTLLGVHSGFSLTSGALLPSVRSAIAGAGGKEVWLTGHSLGGAMATATAQALEADLIAPIDVQGVVTFGAPRVFVDGPTPIDGVADAFDATLGSRHQRWVNDLDPVPHLLPNVPLLFQYRHTGVTNHITPEGTGCALGLDTAEVHLITEDDIAAAFDGVDWANPTSVATALEAFGGTLATASDFDDHDTARYATRMYHHLPLASREQLPTPPLPANPENDCDYLPDTTPPTITPVIDGILGDNGWYVSDVTVSWEIDDDESAVTIESGCEETEITHDTFGQPVFCAASSDGGGEFVPLLIKRDAMPPLVSTVEADREPDQNGWYNEPFTATWDGVDNLSGIASCTQTTYSGPDDVGTLWGTCKDEAGNVSSERPFFFLYDNTAPVFVSVDADRSPDHNGWYNEPFTATWDGGDALSGGVECTETIYGGPDTSTGSLDGSCTDRAGNTSNTVPFIFQYDSTAPTGVTVAPDRAADHNGWYNEPFTATWSGTDALSGIASCTQTTYSGADTSSGSIDGSCTDDAGNSSALVSFAPFKFDDTDPTATITTPADGADFFRHQTVKASYSCGDNLSGAASCAGPVASGSPIDTASFGSRNFTVSTTDQAGNTGSATNGYSVTYEFDGFRAPVDNLPLMNTAKAGRTIPFKWAIRDADGNPVGDNVAMFDVGWGARTNCTTTASDTIETYDTSGASGLRWDPVAQQYVFTGASSKSDAGYCRNLLVRVGDHAVVRALVQFVR